MNRAYQFMQYLPNLVALYGYGSSFITQIGYSKTEKENAMDDYLAIVEDVKDFHLQNFDLNSAFYTPNSIRYFLNTSLQKQSLGTSISFISICSYPFLNKLFKMGVASKKEAIKELETWSSLALVGRFSKIIVPFKEDKEFNDAICKNRKNVLLISLLLLKTGEKHTFKDLLEQICSLSYIGDVRKLGFEDPNKVKKIVESNYDAFTKLYNTPNPYFTHLKDDTIQIHYKSILSEIPNFPTNIYEAILKQKDRIQTIEDVQKCILSYIRKCNQKNTVLLAYKGFRVVGVSASCSYVLEKAKKFQNGSKTKTLKK